MCHRRGPLPLCRPRIEAPIVTDEDVAPEAPVDGEVERELLLADARKSGQRLRGGGVQDQRRMIVGERRAPEKREAGVRHLVLLAALPAGATVFVLAQNYRVFVERSSAAVLATTVVSLLTLSAVFVLYGV